MSFDIVATHIDLNNALAKYAPLTTVNDVDAKVEAKVIVLENVAVSQNVGFGPIANLFDTRITHDYELLCCEFDNPMAVTSALLELIPSTGSAVLRGTCAFATTAKVFLVRNDPEPSVEQS